MRNTVKRRKKIIYIVYSLGIGGAEIMIRDLVKGLDRENYEPYVCTFSNGGILEKDFKEMGVQVLVVEKGEGNDFRLPAKLAWALKKMHIDIVHTHNTSVWLYGGIAKCLARIPFLVHTEHSNIPKNKKKLILAKRGLSKLTDQVITVCNDVARFMCEVEKIDNTKIKVIYNGIRMDYFGASKDKYNKRKELGISDEDVVMGIVARLVPAKDHKLLLQAIKLLKDELRFRLLIVGDGELYENLRGLSRSLEIDDKVVFMGARRDIRELLGAMDLFVLSSKSEGCSITLLEAMASELPVVATRVGGNSEIVRHNETGLLVPHGDPVELAQAIFYMFSNPERMRKFGKEGRERALKQFSAETMVKNYSEVYEALYNKKQ
jgi:sugar transferase (PEP-CTERM/EpsH1 system associated)